MQFEPGDLAACHGADWTSWGIRCVTASVIAPRRLRLGPSHVAILGTWRDEAVWLEATTLATRPCLVRDRVVNGAQAHRPEERLREYVAGGGWVDFYRLTPVNRLSAQESRLLTRILLNHFVEPGVDYDYGGALLSGTRWFQATKLFPGADLNQLFCSELVAAVVMRLNRLNHSNPTRYHPARLLRELVTTGKYQFVRTIRSEGDLDG